MEDNNLTTYGDQDQTRPSTCSDKPTRNFTPSAEIRHLISGLGLRYRPSVQADLEAHAAQIAFLAKDVAHLDPRDLEVAIAQHVARSPFLPKACELIELADNARSNREWVARPRLEASPSPEPEIDFEPCTPEQAKAIMAEFGLRRNPLSA